LDRAHGPLGPLLSRARRKKDLELEAGATAHFEDPAWYTKSYARRKADVAYYRALAKTKRVKAVLEYGIGNGRIAIPLARDGVRVTGIERSAPMIADLRTRLADEPVDVRGRVSVKQGDMRRATTGKRFALVICPFNTALHLYVRADVERWLACVRKQITRDGVLVLDVNMPIMEDLADPAGTEYVLDPVTHPTLGRVPYKEVFDYDRVRQIQFCSMCFGDDLVTPLAHRVFFPQELEALLHYNGFETTQILGDFEGGALKADSDVMIFHARPR
jgi:predicted O-methyltransferase YrrM